METLEVILNSQKHGGCINLNSLISGGGGLGITVGISTESLSLNGMVEMQRNLQLFQPA